MTYNLISQKDNKTWAVHKLNSMKVMWLSDHRHPTDFHEILCYSGNKILENKIKKKKHLEDIFFIKIV